jgi:hypothetical protein
MTIAFGEGRFVVMGGYGILLTSTNGLDWVEQPLGSEVWFTKVIYGNGRFVALGTPNIFLAGEYVIATSTDGLNWTFYPTGEFHGDIGTFGLAYGNGQFVALTRYGLLLSRDGTTWAFRRFTDWVTEWRLGSIGYGDGHFVAVGGGGTILQSGDIISLTVQSTSGYTKRSLSVEGPTGRNYMLQVSTNLTSWSDWTNFTSIGPTTVLGDAPEGMGNQVFFRATTR